MPNPRHFAITLARTVEVLRARPTAIPEQKAALRALLALIKLGPATVSVDNGAVLVDGNAIPNSLSSMAGLSAQMTAHGVARIEIAKGASGADVLNLVRTLATDPGAPGSEKRLAGKLGESDVAGVSVLTLPTEQIGRNRRPVSVTGMFEMPAEAMASAEQLATSESVAKSQATPDLFRELESLRIELEGKREIIEELRRSRSEFEQQADEAEHVVATSEATAAAAAEEAKDEAEKLAKEVEALTAELEREREVVERLRRSKMEMERRAVAAERALGGGTRRLFSMFSRPRGSLFSSSSSDWYELTVTLKTTQSSQPNAGYPSRFAIVGQWVPRPGGRLELTWRAVDGDDDKGPREGPCRIDLSSDGTEATMFIAQGGQPFDSDEILTCTGPVDDSRAHGTFTDRLFCSRAGTFVCAIQKLK